MIAAIVILIFLVIVCAYLKWFTCAPKRQEVMSPNNYPGVPPKDLTWETAWQYVKPSISPMCTWKSASNCPICDKELVEYKADKQEVEGGYFQYMVRGNYCPDGHYTNLDCA